MRYGHFDDQCREYVIDRPDTPLPWINYLGTEAYFALISNTAGGYSFYKDAKMRRISRYRYNNVPLDVSGRYIYLRNNETKEVWSPTWQPVRKALEKYQCKHGLGYTIISTTYQNIEAKITYFVPLGETLEIWRLELQNHSAKPVNLSVFSSIEFCLWNAHDDATNFQRNLNTGEVEVEDGVIYHKTEYRERRNHFAFFACSESLDGYDTQRETFLGAYRGWEKPLVVEQGRSTNSKASGWTPIGSHHKKIVLNSGDSKEIIFVLGYHENDITQKFDPPDSNTINKKTVKKVIKKYLQKENVDTAFNALTEFWSNLLNKFQINTPDVHANRMINIWNAYQCITTFNLSRSASYFESGISRGIGFRDSNQDLLGFMHMDPRRARDRIIELASTQLENGGAFHQFQPLTKQGNNEIGGNFNDDPLWLILSTAAYLKETGDWNLLKVPVVYESKIGTEQPLVDHLRRSLHYVHDRKGPHGLPLIGRADWNDCLNLNCFSTDPNQSFQTTENRAGKVAESIFLAGMFVLAANELADLHHHSFSEEFATRYRTWGKEMEMTVLKYGWDGNWFLRAYDDASSKVGSHECKEGQIFIETQGFCIIAGIGLDNGFAKKALDAVKTHLATPHGILLLQPAFTRYDLRLGEISSYPPGYKENASVFCHANPWIMIAEAIVGDGNQAFDYYTRINPSVREEISELHRCEPYIYTQTIAGRDAPNYGEAKNSWLTGTASWTYVAMTHWILGIRPTLTGLEVNPVIPKNWSGYRANRNFRGVMYNITVKREGTGNNVTLKIDGIDLKGTIIPLPEAKKRVVDVIAIIK
ncbi:MAG: putative cellobiose phosphorylase [Promethearchaeota archaeon CR_4]|nr:MAG: putative cellobiose phosphorylase [Candidatus Lokiarchaeota archaeon CR_4]